ncbi:ornithine--oxo-acid transaminase [Candidatus Fermentibacteria bacterium]|nr:ornithine--oxo-acid transaminase [Candidatus Fermentibacteria bacterium]
MTSRDAMAIEEAYGAHNYHPIPVVLTRGEGVWVWDVEDMRYLDMLSAYSAHNLGHAHPGVLAVAHRQLERLTLTSRAFHNDLLGIFCRRLAEFCGLEMVLPMNTGAEAVETAIKTARKWGYQVKGVEQEKAEIIVCCENFHGRTTTIISFSTDPVARNDYGPYTPGFTIIPFGNAAALEEAITPNTVAFLVEPIQGEAGVKVPPDGYLSAARQICTRHNVLLVLDEVQTGFCRTGKRFCHHYEDATPDILVLGKALGGGVMPVSAVVSRRDILSVFKPGEHGSTFGGNPLACAIAMAALDALEDPALLANAARQGERFRSTLRSIDNPVVREVRGRGLLNAIELDAHKASGRKVSEALQARGVLAKETHQNIIRFAPPLIIDDDEMSWALERIIAVIRSL